MSSLVKIFLGRHNVRNQSFARKLNCFSSSIALVTKGNRTFCNCVPALPYQNSYLHYLKRLNSASHLVTANNVQGLFKRDFANFHTSSIDFSHFLSSAVAGSIETKSVVKERGSGVEGPHRRFKSDMPPLGNMEAIKAKIDALIKDNKVMIFSKSWCPFCAKVKTLFGDLKTDFHSVELDLMEPDEGAQWQEALSAKTGQKTVPNVFVKGKHIGGCDDTFKAYRDNTLKALLQDDKVGDTGATIEVVEGHKYTYDLIVVGGGSGGLAAAKAAAKMGMKVALCDFVQPTPIGTAWGLGGTCVNVGCIPKKLMHQAALLGQSMGDAPSYGWNLQGSPTHDWNSLVENVQMYIKSLNWGYRVALKDAGVTYLNEYAQFVDQHTVETVNKKGKKQILTANNFLVAVGGRPRYPDIPGALELGVTSDDIFQLPYNPGKVLCIGASYIALECAGFLAGLGLETSVMVRSILLRGFDQQVADMIGDHMEEHGVKFYRGWIPTEIVKIEEGTPPKLLVKAKETNGSETLEVEVNTVLLAIGRDPCTQTLNLQSAKVEVSKSGKIITNEADQTSSHNIFAIGDVAEGRPELTPVAIHAGNLLARRLAEGSTVLTDYDKVPTTVFTPLEYGCVGLSEEDAVKRYGADDVEVYHTNFQPLESTLPKRDENKSYCKLVCVKSQNERVVGFHYVGPNAGEVTQGFALGVKMGATKADFDSTIGIHPTTAETFTTLNITKSSGASALKTGC